MRQTEPRTRKGRMVRTLAFRLCLFSRRPISLSYTGVNRHAASSRIGLMDSAVPVEAMVSGVGDVASLRDAGEAVGDDRCAYVSPQCFVMRSVTTLRTRLRTTSGIALRGSVGTTLRLSTSTTLRGFAAGMVLPAPGGASHLSEMLTLPARTAPPTPSLGEAERTQCR